MKDKLKSFGGLSYILAAALLFALIFMRYCYFGFEYYLQLDDYIQYHNYTAYNSDLGELISRLGLLSSRPLAGILDIFLWSKFYGGMIWAIGLISAMYAASAVFFHKVFSKRFGTAWLFFIVYALLPFSLEGVYWISASSRIVVGMFFASVSLLLFDQWCSYGQRWRLWSFFIMQLAAFCLYEQVFLLSAAATFIIMLYELKDRNRRALWGLLMFLNAGIYFTITSIAPSGVYGERTALFLPWQEGYKQAVFIPLSGQIKNAFLGGAFGSFGKGLLRGAALLFSEPNVLYAPVLLILSLLLFLLSHQTRRTNSKVLQEIIVGFFLATAPLLLFYVIKDPWFGLRNTVSSLCGLGLIADALFDLLFGRFKKGGEIQAAFISIAVILCCLASISEIHDYRDIYLADTAISKAAGETLISAGYSEDDDIWLLNVDASYLEDANFYFHEHGYGVSSSDWALTGAVRALSGRGDIPRLKPMSVYRHFPADADEVEKARAFYYLDGSFQPVYFEKEGAGWIVNLAEEGPLGRLRYIDEGVFLERSED